MSTSIDLEPLHLRIPEAAAFARIGTTKLYELINAGEIETITVDRRRLVPIAAIREYFERLRAEQNGRAA